MGMRMWIAKQSKTLHRFVCVTEHMITTLMTDQVARLGFRCQTDTALVKGVARNLEHNGEFHGSSETTWLSRGVNILVYVNIEATSLTTVLTVQPVIRLGGLRGVLRGTPFLFCHDTTVK